MSCPFQEIHQFIAGENAAWSLNQNSEQVELGRRQLAELILWVFELTSSDIEDSAVEGIARAFLQPM